VRTCGYVWRFPGSVVETIAPSLFSGPSFLLLPIDAATGQALMLNLFGELALQGLPLDSE
jgi:hypothetical protein